MRTQTAPVVHPSFVAFTPVVYCLALALGVALPQAAQTPALSTSVLNDAFARMDKTAQQFKSVAANMKRNVHTAVINDDATDMGTIKVKREKSHGTRMLIEFTGTDAKIVSVDGTSVSVYLPKSKLVDVYDFGAKRSLVDQFLLLGFGASSTEMKADYEITPIGNEKIGPENTWHLQLIPKSPDVLHNLKKAELWIAETTGLPVQQRFVTSSTGDFTLITYSNVRFNPPSLSDGALKLTYPKDVKVEHPRL
jgi:outer membrane lipoprotein-sorting protein